MVEEDDDGISTVNTNVSVVADHRLESWEDHERAITVTGLEEPRDIIVLTNRVNDEYGSVTGVSTVTDDVAIIYCDNR